MVILIWLVLLVQNMNSAIVQDEIISMQDQRTIKCFEFISENFDGVHTMFIFNNLGPIINIIAKNQLEQSAQITNFDSPTKTLTVDPLAWFVSFVTNNVDHIAKYFNILATTWGFSNSAQYFIVYLGDEDLDLIFDIVANVYIQRIILLDKLGNLYTSTPYEDGCGKVKRKIFLFPCKEANITTITDVFKSNVTSLYGCPVRALALLKPPFVMDVNDSQHPGMEPSLLKFASTKYNFRINYLAHNFTNWGSKFRDGEYSFMVQELYYKKVDVIFGNFRANATYLEDFDSCGYGFESTMSFYAPAAHKVNNWNAILKVFKLEVWAYITVAIVVITFFVYLISKTAQHPEGYSSLIVIVFKVFRLLLGNSDVQPKHLLMRILFLSWAIFCFVFSGIYSSTLIAFLVTPHYAEEIDTIDEGVTRGLKFGGNNLVKQIFDSHFYHKYLSDNWIYCGIDLSCTNRTAFKRDLITLENDFSVNYAIKDFVGEAGRSKLHIMKPAILYYSSWMLVRKGFPITELVSKTIKELREAGIMQKLVREYIPEINFPEEVKYVSVGIEHLLLLFYVYIVGVLLSLLVFLDEIGLKNISYAIKHYYNHY